MIDNKKNMNIPAEGGFSIVDIIDNLRQIFSLLKNNFWKLIILGLLGGGIGFCIAFFNEPVYSSRFKFIMKESNGSSGLINSLSSIGSLIGGSPGSISPMERALAIIGSERIIGSVLFKDIKVDKKKDLAINHLIEIFKLRKSWANDTILNGVQFSKNDSEISGSSYSKRKAYKIIVNDLIGNNSTIIAKSFDKKNGVFDLSVNTVNEDFSIEFSKLVYAEFELFMYNQSQIAASKNVGILAAKIDSIKSQLNFVQNQLARKTDRTLGLLMQEDKVDQKKLILQEQMLTVMYGEAQKNMETFKFLSESMNAGLEILEFPISPLQPIKKGVLKFSLLGFVIFIISGFTFIYVKKLIL